MNDVRAIGNRSYICMTSNPLTLAAAFDSQLLLLRTGVQKSNAYQVITGLKFSDPCMQLGG